MRRTTTAGIALAIAVAAAVGFQEKPAAAACSATCTGAIPVVSFVCSAPALTSNPALCPLDPSMQSQFVGTVGIPSGYGNGSHKVTLTGKIASQASGMAGRLALRFRSPPYTTQPLMHERPFHT